MKFKLIQSTLTAKAGVNLNILLAKLLVIGFTPSDIQWLDSFLKDCTQNTKINNFIS